jgi:hypothetical protein
MASAPSRYEKTRFVRRNWVFERAGWVVLGVVLIGAALGVFGDGWLSRGHLVDEALTVHYARFGRAHSPNDLVVEWQSPEQQGVLWISRSYLDGFSIEEIRPEPESASIGADRVAYTFRVQDATSARVRFTLRPERVGVVRGRLGSDGGADVEIRQLVFP